MTVQDAQTDPDSQLLERALPAIARLEASLAGEREASRLTLHSENLVDALTNLGHAVAEEREQLDALDRIARDLWRAEEFHSRIISWLLDPSAHHRQAGHFIAALLKATMAPARLLAADWSDAQVLQEWENVVDGQQGYLDILILSRDGRNLIAIENKIFSQEHSNQLTRYRRALADAFPDFARHHIFLSPGGVPANLERDREHWQPASYSVIHNSIQGILETGVAEPNANALLQIYATTIRRNIMPDTSLPQVARRIYLEHREAMDKIIAHKPDWVAEAKQWLKEAVAQHPKWKLDLEGTGFVRFRSTDWDQYDATQTGSGWAPGSNALLLFQFRFDDGLPWLDLGLSPGNAANNRLRQMLFDAARQHPQFFTPRTTTLPDSWAILHQEADYILDEADYGVGWDDGITRAKVEAWVARFATNEFPAMNEVIVNCLREYEAEMQS